MTRRRLIGGLAVSGLAGSAYFVTSGRDTDRDRHSSAPRSGTPVVDRVTERSTGARGTGRDWSRVAAVALQLGVTASVDRDQAPTTVPDGTVRFDAAANDVSVSAADRWERVADPAARPVSTPPPVSDSDRVMYVDPDTGYRGLTDTLEELGSRPGTVVVEPGRIDDIDGNVVVPSHTHLRGTSATETTLAFADGADPSLSGLVRIEGNDVVVSDIELDGNRANVALGSENLGQEYGLYTSGADAVAVERVYCHDFPGYGFDPHADGDEPTRSIIIRDCVGANNGFDGFTFAGVADGIAANNCSLGNDRHGFAATDGEGSDTRFVNNVSIGNGATGAVVQNGYREVDIRNSLLAGNAGDGVRVGATSDRVHDVVLADCSVRNSQRYGVNLRSSMDAIITGCRFDSNNRGGDATATIALTGDGGSATGSRLLENTIRALDGTQYGIDERPGNGPTIVRNNDITGVDEPVRLTHPQSRG